MLPVETPPPDAFAVHRAEVRPGMQLAYLHEGVGGHPLLLIHGYPETKRIFWRNVAPLAAAGFEVIVPDLRGFGDSDLAPDGFYDPAAYATDLHRLVTEVLGHERCVAGAGDLGGAVLYDLGLRFPGFVERQVFWNGVTPMLPEQYAAAGVPADLDRTTRMAADYFLRQGTDADALCAELTTPEQRRRYVAAMYGHRFWAAPGTFEPADVDFMTEPFADPEHFRTAMAPYELTFGNRPLSEPVRMFETNPVPTVVLYGPDDHVVPPSFPHQCAVAFTECIGPYVVPGAGHFLQWEQAHVFNQTCRGFLLR